jgi:carotenoid 1,2-hydratase
MERPSLNWSGLGYMDCNEGAASLESDFVEWDWCRAPTKDGTTILYNAVHRVGGAKCLALRVGRLGHVEAFVPPPVRMLPRTRWGMKRQTRADAGATPRVRKTLEDTPFYSRSVIEMLLGGENSVAMHESLSLARFRAPWVQAMLPFRMPRRW